jgi:putative transposase
MAKPDLTDKLIDKLLAGKKPEEILGKDGALDDLRRRLFERALEGEMTEHLGYPPHSPAGQLTGNSCNGKTRKTIKDKNGELEIAVPRDRNGDFEPQLVKKRQRRLPGFDDKVIALYACGMTTREIQGHLKELYGSEVSPSLISNVTPREYAENLKPQGTSETKN